MGNQNNNFSNKSQQLSLYHLNSHSPSTNLTHLLHKHTNSPFLLKTITTDSQQKCKQIKRIIMKKIDHKKVPITQLQHAFLEENEEFCGRGYQIGLVFQVGEGRTLKEEVERRKEKEMFEEKELMGLMKRLVMAVSFFKQVEQRHEMVSLSNVHLKEGQFILADPWISTEEGVCQSPERLDVRKNGKVDYDWFGSDLYSIGMVALEAYHLRSMSYLYDNKRIDEQKLREEVRLIKYKDVQKLVRQLLGPPRLRIQALSSLLSFPLPSQPSSVSIPTPIPSFIPSSPLKSHNLLPPHKQQIKRQAKKQMKRELKQTKEQIKKMIQSNSTRQIHQQPLFKIKTRIDPEFKSKDKRELSRCRSISKQPSSIQINRSQQKSRVVVNNIYNYNSHIHIHPPAQQIKYHTTINLTINEHAREHQPYQQQQESPHQGKSRHHHSHTRSNSGLLYFPTNSASHMKPSTGSTYHIRSNSTLSNNQESYVTIREEQSKEYSKQYQGEIGRKDLYTTPFDHIKDTTTKGVLNTTVSEHNISMNNNSLHSLSNSISNSLRHQPNEFNNMLVQQYMKQYSSVVNISNIDQLNINSSIISNPSHSNLNSKHTIINTKSPSHSRSHSNISNNSISSSHSHRSVKEINTLAPTQQPQIYQQLYGNRSIVNENEGGAKDQSSLLYSESRSKSMSRTVSNVMQQQSETSFDLPMLIKMESQMSRQSSVNDTESQLLASQFTQKTNKSNHSVQHKDKQPSRLTALISSPSYQYQGKLKNNLKQGQGKLFSSSGKLIYQGEWRNNQYQGYGKLVNQNIIFGETNYKDLNLKRGNWINYEGSFIRGEMYGFGKVVFCGGEVYEGEFVEGEISGFGQFFDEMEEVVDGVWKGGKLERLI